MAELSNNPFIDSTSSALSRFPNINAVSSPPAQPSAPQYSTCWPQQHQQQQTGYGGYPPQQQEQEQHQLTTQFDPYPNMGQISSPGSATTSMVPITNGAVGSPPPGVQHPRLFIQTHKVELEAWDPPTWRQVQNVFEAL